MSAKLLDGVENEMFTREIAKKAKSFV